MLDELLQRDGVDVTTALFSESQARVIVSVPREDDVRFTLMCEARKLPILRIGVTDGDALEVQGQFTVPVAELQQLRAATLPSRFGDRVTE